MSVDLVDLQRRLAEWQAQNFTTEPDPRYYQVALMALGVCEETGEAAHAILKRAQGVRGNPDQLKAKLRDAVGDNVVFLMQLCTLEGWTLLDIISEVAEEVMQRDWKANALNGQTETNPPASRGMDNAYGGIHG